MSCLICSAFISSLQNPIVYIKFFVKVMLMGDGLRKNFVQLRLEGRKRFDDLRNKIKIFNCKINPAKKVLFL
jgi:hypothetical protein